MLYSILPPAVTSNLVHSYASVNACVCVQDAASLVGQSLEEPSPEWQLGKQHFAHKDRYGSIVDENAHSLSERDP